MIVITGAAGFIGSCLVGYFNQLGRMDMILIDDFNRTDKRRNLINKNFAGSTDRSLAFDFISTHYLIIEAVIHIGARTDTTLQDVEVFNSLNFEYSKKIFSCCAARNIPLIYASSAATYGDGKMGYNDEFKIEDLKPLNPYAHSKHNFDLWVESQKIKPDFWVGLKFFNVYGPNEYHKNRMASVVYHAFNQIKQTGAVSLFKSHNDNFNDGEQLRDFVYVKDLLSVIVWMLKNKPKSGIYNLGSGEARSFNSLVNSIFNTLDLTPQITYIDTPIDIRNAYQYYTQATMNKLKSAGYNQEFYSLEAGVSDYVRNYLSQAIYY
jgi:ADP-L-glycero-D-manno-heptose 6-epimerase